jgi:hypothetical protein
MKKTRIVVALISVASASVGWAGAIPDELAQRLTTAIRARCPNAQIEKSDEGFVAKDGTMLFTIHGRSKTGEVSATTHQEEGPNFRGFLLRISREDGTYQGAAVVPQTLQQPYFQTFIDARPTDGGAAHYHIRFSFGTRLDAELKAALLEALPKEKP